MNAYQLLAIATPIIFGMCARIFIQPFMPFLEGLLQ